MVERQRDFAMLAALDMSALRAENIGVETASVLQQDHLFIPLQTAKDGSFQFRTDGLAARPRRESQAEAGCRDAVNSLRQFEQS